jgi:protein NRD1
MSSGLQQPSAPAAAAPSILEALALMARQNTTTSTATANIPAPSSSYSVPNVQSNPAQQMASMNPPYAFPSTQPVNVPASAANFAPQPQGSSNTAQNVPSNPAMPYGVAQPPIPPEPNAALQQQILLFKTLSDQGIPQDQWAGIIAALNAVQGVGAGAGGMLPAPQLPPTKDNQNGWGARPEESRDRNGYHNREPVRSPPGRFRRRSRSPSPTRAWGARDSPPSRRRDEPGYGDYDRGRNSPGRDNRARDRGNDYRQRSPPPGRRGRSPSPDVARGEKWVDYDPTIGKENIKGWLHFPSYRSTLTIPPSFEPYAIRWRRHVSFNCSISTMLLLIKSRSSDQELRSLFNRFGKVQTCIVNKDKRHAFVKMVSRKDAVAAKDAMESNRTPDSQLRVRSVIRESVDNYVNTC